MRNAQGGGRGHVIVGADEASPVITDIETHLRRLGFDVTVIGPPAHQDMQWAQVGRRVGELVASGDAVFGVVACWTGTGVSIAANKVPGVRAALVTDAQTAAGARRWNDANVVALSLRLLTPALASEVLDAWVSQEFDPSEQENIAQVEPTPTTSTQHG